MVIAHLLFVATAIAYLLDRIPPGGRGLSQWLALLGGEFWVVVLMSLNALTLLWEVWLLREQFDAVASGTTTYFRLGGSSAQQRSLRQRWVTVITFLLEGGRRVSGGQTGDAKNPMDI